jgi:hypothetical protein
MAKSLGLVEKSMVQSEQRTFVVTGQPVFSTAAFNVHRQFFPSVTVNALHVWHNGSLSQLCWQYATVGTVASPVSEPPGNAVLGIILLRLISLLPGLRFVRDVISM